MTLFQMIRLFIINANVLGFTEYAECAKDRIQNNRTSNSGFPFHVYEPLIQKLGQPYIELLLMSNSHLIKLLSLNKNTQ